MELEPLARMARDLRNASATLSRDEARFLVDSYYAMQKDRIRDNHQKRQLTAANEPASVLSYLGEQHELLEGQIAKALDVYSDAQPIGRWMRSIVGIGPVISAGFIAHIDIARADTASDIWRFAGLDPTVKWEKKTKRPWNASLKTLCWKLGESFVKTSNHEDAVYGRVYKRHKTKLEDRNVAGEYAEQCKVILAGKRFRDDTQAIAHYQAGRLPPAHIHARAKRYAVKLFLSHMHETWRRMEGLSVREPWIVASDPIHTKIEPPPALSTP